MEKPAFRPDERIFNFDDVKRLYISMWRRLIKWALVGGMLAFLYTGIRVSKYEVEATFKEGIEKSGGEHALRDLLGGISISTHQPQVASLMKSYQVLRPLAEKIGLQVSSPLRTGWIVKKGIKRYTDNLKAEKGLPISDLDPFLFQDVLYEAEKELKLEICFTDFEHFEVYASGREIGTGLLGSEVCINEPAAVKFTITQTPKTLKTGFLYPFTISNWVSAANFLRGEIKIETDEDNASIYHISTLNRDRHLAMRIINELICQYQIYLKREHDQLAKEQLAYLEGKQEQVCAKLGTLFDQHEAYLSQNLEEKGFTSLEQETQSLLVPHQQMQSKVLAIEIELARLEQIEKENKTTALVDDGPFSHGLNQIASRIQDLKQQRDLLELSLCQITEISLELRRDELKQVRDQRFAVANLLQEVGCADEISSFDFNPGLSVWASALKNPEEREDFSEYLENYERLLSIREKMLQERFFYGEGGSSELEGIDLATARTLFVEYNNKLDKAEVAIKRNAQLKREISNSAFEIASLSSILTDPLSQKIISDTSAMGLMLKDEKHHTTKEKQRWEEEISLQKNNLAEHLDQLIKVEELNASLNREKMISLQKIGLDCINRQISVLHEQTSDSIKERRSALTQEKNLLEKKMAEIRSLATQLPEKWRFEKWLNLKTQMSTQMTSALTELVESKTISHHLHHVGSKPLDAAMLPLTPKGPRLYLKTYLGAFAFAMAAFLFALIRRILKGFPVTLEKLRALRLPVLGSISTFCDGPSVETPTGPDLELLRQVALFTEGRKVIGLLGGKGPDYSYALGENLARMSTKSIVLRCDFLSKFCPEDCPGLLQVWKEEVEELPIRQGKGFDFITAGGYSAFGPEIIQSQNFSQLVEALKENYDRVFLLFRAPLASAESNIALRLCEKVIVTVAGEQTEELTPFVNWGYDEDNWRLTFITQS